MQKQVLFGIKYLAEALKIDTFLYKKGENDVLY